MVNPLQTLGRKIKSFVGKTKDETATFDVATEEQLLVDLNSICATVHHGCMGLPQELVDHTMDMLHDNLPALKACSLTCKAMFASTRHLIHQTLCLTPQGMPNAFTDVEERGFLQYIQRVSILHYKSFPPSVLQPHLREFQSLGRVHTLTFEGYHTVAWIFCYKVYFTHLYPTLTSLTLRRPSGSYRLIMKFVLQFPNLENLCLESMNLQERFTLLSQVVHVDEPPPLGGHLRLAGYANARGWPEDSSSEVPNGVGFRSIELEDFSGRSAQHMLDACAHTLESLTIVLYKHGRDGLLDLGFEKLLKLRRLTLRFAFTGLHEPFFEHTLLLESLSTITSSIFREFVLEPHDRDFDSTASQSAHWRRWEKIDKFLEEWFSEGGDFRVIIRTRDLDYDWGTLRTLATEGFPLLMRKGCIRFDDGQ